MNCEKCGAQLGANDKFCPICGAEQKMENLNNGTFCKNCGTEIFESDTFCPGCGKRTKEPEPVPTPAPEPVYNPSAPVYQPQPQKQSNAAVTALIVILAVVVAAAIAVGIWALTRNGNDSDYEPNSGESTELAEATPTPAPPEFDWVVASSTRGYDKDSSTGEIVHYYPEYAVDGDMRTAWTPDRTIESIPTITLNAHEDQYVTGIRMTNGYCKSEKTYTRNRRITRARISYRGGEKEVTFGIDNYRAMLSVRFDEPVYTDYISITVLDSHYGDWKDIAISEIEVF